MIFLVCRPEKVCQFQYLLTVDNWGTNDGYVLEIWLEGYYFSMFDTPLGKLR
jgi:hypothetical protein